MRVCKTVLKRSSLVSLYSSSDLLLGLFQVLLFL